MTAPGSLQTLLAVRFRPIAALQSA